MVTNSILLRRLMEGWIKLHRKMTEWEWYKDNNTKSLFIHLLLMANHKDSKYQGQEVKRGQLITGRKVLSVQTGLSERQIRTSLNKLKATNEIAIKTSTKNSLISIIRYNSYQIDLENDLKETSKATNERPTSDQRATTNKNDNNDKNVLNEESHNQIFRSLWKNRIWIEQLCLKWKKEPKDVLDHLNSFRLECISKDELKVDEKDAKSHFINWVKFNQFPEEQKTKGYVYNPPSLKSFEQNDF